MVIPSYHGNLQNLSFAQDFRFQLPSHYKHPFYKHPWGREEGRSPNLYFEDYRSD